jgi:hypothetical protein
LPARLRIPLLYRWLLLVGAGAVCVVIGVLLTLSLPGLFQNTVRTALQPPATVQLTAQLLHSEDLMFMVTNRVVTQVMVQQEQDSLWAGTREGVLVATVRIYYGVDMAKVTDQDIHDLPDRVVIVLPSPGVLDFAIDPDFKIITKRSGVNVVLDWMYGNDIEAELRSHIKNAGMTFARDNDLLPGKAAVLRRLNQTAALLSGKAGKPVVFAFDPPRQQENTTQPAVDGTTTQPE